MSPQRRIEVVPPDPAWAGLFTAEAELLRDLLGDTIVAIHHIGSTAIPGIVAKPIIDLLVEVRDTAAIDARTEELVAAGHVAKGEFGIPGRRYFLKGTEEERSHHVHIFPVGHPRLADHLDFRDYLRAHPAEAAAYGRLKAELAQRHPHDIEAYMAGKDAFIQDIVAKATVWRAAGGSP